MVTHASPADGNVFADIGLPDADELRAKADLVIAVTRIIRQQRLTQTQAAALVGLGQPDLSRLLRGKMEGFSIERLIRVLAALGYEVVVQVRPAERLQRQRVARAGDLQGSGPEPAGEAAA